MNLIEDKTSSILQLLNVPSNQIPKISFLGEAFYEMVVRKQEKQLPKPLEIEAYDGTQEEEINVVKLQHSDITKLRKEFAEENKEEIKEEN